MFRNFFGFSLFVLTVSSLGHPLKGLFREDVCFVDQDGAKHCVRFCKKVPRDKTLMAQVGCRASIPHYKASLYCNLDSSNEKASIERGVLQFNYDIVRAIDPACVGEDGEKQLSEGSFEMVGLLMAQYMPHLNKLRLRLIEVEKRYQSQKYGSEALETFFRDMRGRSIAEKNPTVSLEMPWSYPPQKEEKDLFRWYQSFGFNVSTKESACPGSQILTVPLNKTKFPLYKKRKEAFKEAESAQ